MPSEQQPTLNENGIVSLIHVLGGIFYFLPALIGFFVLNNLSENGKNSIKTALNFQLSISGLLIILSIFAQAAGFLSLFLLPFISLIWLLFPVIYFGNFIISLIAGFSYYKNGNAKYPVYFEFIK